MYTSCTSAYVTGLSYVLSVDWIRVADVMHRTARRLGTCRKIGHFDNSDIRYTNFVPKY